MKEITVEAREENLFPVRNLVDEQLETVGCPIKLQVLIAIAVEEIFTNISRYAYDRKIGNVTVHTELHSDPSALYVTFMDSGMPYDPLANVDPDVTLPGEERAIGGLGILMVKKSMDDLKYEYRDGHNILTLKKLLPV